MRNNKFANALLISLLSTALWELIIKPTFQRKTT